MHSTTLNLFLLNIYFKGFFLQFFVMFYVVHKTKEKYEEKYYFYVYVQCLHNILLTFFDQVKITTDNIDNVYYCKCVLTIGLRYTIDFI